MKLLLVACQSTIKLEHDPPKHKEDTVQCEVVYHEMPAHAHNFKNDEVLACAAHRLRAQHGIKKPADIIIYYGPRAEYEKGAAPDTMSDETCKKQVRAYALYDQLAYEAGLMVKRPDWKEADDCYNKYQQQWDAAKAKCKKLRGTGIPEDINAYGKAQKELSDLDEILNYLTWNGTAKPGYIYMQKQLPEMRAYGCCDAPTQGANASARFLWNWQPRGWSAHAAGHISYVNAS